MLECSAPRVVANSNKPVLLIGEKAKLSAIGSTATYSGGTIVSYAWCALALLGQCQAAHYTTRGLWGFADVTSVSVAWNERAALEFQ